MRIALIPALLLITACGTVRGGFISNLPASGATSAVGVVSFVGLRFVPDGSGAMVSVTAVTLVGGRSTSNLTLCGDQHSQFPSNQTVTATFTPGTVCASLLSVTSP